MRLRDNTHFPGMWEQVPGSSEDSRGHVFIQDTRQQFVYLEHTCTGP